MCAARRRRRLCASGCQIPGRGDGLGYSIATAQCRSGPMPYRPRSPNRYPGTGIVHLAVAFEVEEQAQHSPRSASTLPSMPRSPGQAADSAGFPHPGRGQPRSRHLPPRRDIEPLRWQAAPSTFASSPSQPPWGSPQPSICWRHQEPSPSTSALAWVPARLCSILPPIPCLPRAPTWPRGYSLTHSSTSAPRRMPWRPAPTWPRECSPGRLLAWLQRSTSSRRQQVSPLECFPGCLLPAWPFAIPRSPRRLATSGSRSALLSANPMWRHCGRIPSIGYNI